MQKQSFPAFFNLYRGRSECADESSAGLQDAIGSEGKSRISGTWLSLQLLAVERDSRLTALS